MAREYLLKLMA